MFARSMKILTLNANNTSAVTQSDGDIQTITKVLNKNGNDKIEQVTIEGSAISALNHKFNKREQKHCSKTKFINGNSSNKIQLPTTEQQSQKYNSKIINSNKHNNSNKMKNQHYNNGNNNNSTSTLNRKKYYQNQHHQHQHQHQPQKHYQQEHQQKQSYLTALPKTVNTSPTTTIISINSTTNFHNNSPVKNKNYSNIEFLEPKHYPEQNQEQHNNINNLVNHSKNVMESYTDLIQETNCDNLSVSSCSSGSSTALNAPSLTTATGDYNSQEQQSHTICYRNNLKNNLSSNTKTPKTPEEQLQSATSGKCNSTYTFNNLYKVATAPPTSKCDSNQNFPHTTTTAITSSLITSSTTTSSASRSGQLHVTSNTRTSSALPKRKQIWKKFNTLGVVAANLVERAAFNLSYSSDCPSDKTALSAALPQNKEHHVSDETLVKNTSTNFSKIIINNNNGNEQKHSNRLAANINKIPQTQITKHQLPTVENIAMTSSLEASSNSTAITAAVSTNESNSLVYSTATSCPISTTQQLDILEKCDDSKQIILKSPQRNCNNNKSDIDKTTTPPASSKNTIEVGKSPQNSYSLDFLHSVGVTMTDMASSRSPEKQASTNVCDKQPATHSPVHKTYSYTAGMTANQRQTRHLYDGSSTNNDRSGNQQQHYHHHHHHQPPQLTIASFINKELLGADSVRLSGNKTTDNLVTTLSSNSRNTNNYNKQQHYTHQQPPNQNRYRHYAASYQQQPPLLQTANYVGDGGGGFAGEVPKFVTNSSGGGHRNSGYAYMNYYAVGEGRMSKQHQQHQRQLKCNFRNYRNSSNNSQTNKNSSYASSITSTGSSSSSNSISSNSSNIAGHNIQMATAKDSNNNNSNLSLAIETLPSKMLGGSNQRTNHKGHHNHNAHKYNNHNHQHLMLHSPSVSHHQNYYNLTYVTTDNSANNASDKECSPALHAQPPPLPIASIPATAGHSPKSMDHRSSQMPMLMNFNANHIPYHRYSHAQQFSAQQQQQQQQSLGKKMYVPLSLHMPSPPIASPTTVSHNAHNSKNSEQTTFPFPPPGIVPYSKLEDNTNEARGIIPAKDCDAENASPQIQHSSLKAIKSSSIYSASSSPSSSETRNPVIAQRAQQQTCSQPTIAISCPGPTTPLHIPLDYNFSAATSQTFPNVQMSQQQQQQQVQQFHVNNNGALISLYNIPTKSQNMYIDEDYSQQQHAHHHNNSGQNQQHQQLYLNTAAGQLSPDHLHITTALASLTGNNGRFWNPSYHNNQFLYQHTPSPQQVNFMSSTNPSSSSSCGSSSASISPILSTEEFQQLNEKFSNTVIGNGSKRDSATFLVGSSSCSSDSSSLSGCISNGNGFGMNSFNGVPTYQTRSSQQLLAKEQRLVAQQTYHSPSATSSVPTTTIRSRGEGEFAATTTTIRSNHLPPPQTTLTSSLGSAICGFQELPATISSHPYSHHPTQHQQSISTSSHDLLYSSQIHHMRSLNASSTHEFFTHTPPDRFLARSHLVEVKDAPITLLNNSKWDHLSQDIWNKFINSQQTEETYKQKMRLWRNLYVFIKNSYPRYGLYLVGSTISGFGSDSSDVDMCLVTRTVSSIEPRTEALGNLTILRDCLENSGEFDDFNLIGARVPILRFRDRINQFEVDLNFNNCVGIKNTHLLYCYSQLDWRLRPLVLVIKLWAQYHNINNAKNMTISSYSLVLMVIHFLQYAVNPPVLPCLHEIFPDKFPLLRSNDFGYVDMNEAMGPYDSNNTLTIGELFLSFLEYYSYFDYAQFAISVRTGGILPINLCRVAKSHKNDIHQWKVLCIEEPFDLTNTARSVYNPETFERVKAVFLASWHMLQETLDLNSVFSTIIPTTCFTEMSSSVQNINLRTTSSALIKIYPNEAYAKESIILTNNAQNYKDHEKSADHDDVANNDNDDHDGIITVDKGNEKVYGKKKFTFPLPSSSSLSCISTSTRNADGNNITKKLTTSIIS